MRLWILLTFAAAFCGYSLWTCEPAFAQAPAGAVVVAPDGTVTGAPVVQPSELPAWVVDTVKAGVGFARNKQWGPLMALILTALVALFSLALRLYPPLFAWCRPRMGYVALGLTLALYLAGNVAAIEVGASAVDWITVIGGALVYGMAACGGWELVLKPLLRRFTPKLAASLAAAPADAPKP